MLTHPQFVFENESGFDVYKLVLIFIHSRRSTYFSQATASCTNSEGECYCLHNYLSGYVCLRFQPRATAKAKQVYEIAIAYQALRKSNLRFELCGKRSAFTN